MQRLRVHGVGLTDPLGKLHLLGKGLLVRLSALVHITQSQIPFAQYASGQRGVIGVPLLFTGQAGHDLVTAFGLHAVGRNLHSVCVAYALVGKLLLAALISLHKRLQVIIVCVAGHVALAGNFGPVKLPLCRAYRVWMVSQCGDRLLHTLVCGGHEFRNAAAFGGGGEQTVARTSCVGLIGSIISCVFGAVNRPQIRNFFLHPSLQHLPRLAAGIWERHTRGLFKRLPQFAAGFQLVNLLVGQRAAAVCVHNHVNGSFRGCIGCYHAKLRNAFLRSLERLLCGGFRAGRYRFRFGGYGVFRGR